MTPRLTALLLITAAACGCRTGPEMPDMPKAPTIVRVPVTEYVVPDWLVKPLPEDAPKANTPEEAVRLACVRLGTIQVANCRFAQARALQQGKTVDPLACDRLAVKQCEVRR